MKRVLFRFLLFVLLIGSSAFYLFLSYPRDFSTIISGHYPPSFSCPLGIRKTLENQGLEVSFPPVCSRWRYYNFGFLSAKVAHVSYAFDRSGDVFGDKSATILFIPKFVFFNKAYILSKDFLSDYEIKIFLRNNLNTPFYGHTNFTLENLSTQKVTNDEDGICFRHHLKFPFQGKISQCLNADNGFLIDGDISYVDGIITWKEAETLVNAQCENYKLRCIYKSWAKKDLLSYWDGYPGAISGIKISDLNPENDSYYIFVRGTYNKGKEGMIAVKVFFDGRVESKLVERKSYKISEILEL